MAVACTKVGWANCKSASALRTRGSSEEKGASVKVTSELRISYTFPSDGRIMSTHSIRLSAGFDILAMVRYIAGEDKCISIQRDWVDLQIAQNLVQMRVPGVEMRR